MPTDAADMEGSLDVARVERFLRALADPARSTIAAHEIAVVLAHPDDETIGCGAQLLRLRGITLITITDGAPRNLVDARVYGFQTAGAYAAARRRELLHALALADVPDTAFIGLAVPDQQASLNLPAIAHTLCRTVIQRSIGVVLTHAFEGGHPDHDATAFAVHAAAALLARGGRSLSIVEMPLYRQGPSGPLYQSFAADQDCPEIAIELSSTERSLKQMMFAAHATQREILSSFSCEVERFRRSPAYDFSALPNAGLLFYEQHDWGMTGARWRKLVGAACQELGLDRVL